MSWGGPTDEQGHNGSYSIGKVLSIIVGTLTALHFVGVDIQLGPSELFGLATEDRVQSVNTQLQARDDSIRRTHQQDMGQVDARLEGMEDTQRCIVRLLKQPVDERNEDACSGDPLNEARR